MQMESCRMWPSVSSFFHLASHCRSSSTWKPVSASRSFFTAAYYSIVWRAHILFICSSFEATWSRVTPGLGCILGGLCEWELQGRGRLCVTSPGASPAPHMDFSTDSESRIHVLSLLWQVTMPTLDTAHVRDLPALGVGA